jgi:hypothetical protein
MRLSAGIRSLVIFAFCSLCMFVATAQVVPPEVKAAIAASVKASDSRNADDKQGGFHEEGGIWGVNAAGALVIIPAKPGAANPTASGKTSMLTGDSVDPNLVNTVVALNGQWHVHPSGVAGNQEFAQPPSKQDLLLEASPFPINIVVGARDKIVYFYAGGVVASQMKLKDFLK